MPSPPRLLDLGNGVVIDPQAQLDELDRADFEDSLYLFLRAAWKWIDPAPWVDGWPIEAVCEHLEAVRDGEITRLLINIPPRTGKTSLFSIAFPAWIWAQSEPSHTSGPGTQFLYSSYAEKRSLQDSISCRRLIRSPFFQKYWGGRFTMMKDQDTAHRFANSKGGFRLITSITGTATGEGANILGVDDPNATNEGDSETTIETTNRWWDQTASTRLNNTKLGVFMIVQQRVAEDDLSGHVLEKNIGNWAHLMLPMHYDPTRVYTSPIGWEDPRKEPGELLWPDRFAEPQVKELEATLGPFAAAGQLEQLPAPAGGGVIRRDWWIGWEDRACGKCELSKLQPACRACAQPNGSFPPFDYILASLDTAYTEKTENDFSALTVWGVFTSDTVAAPSRILDASGRPMDGGRRFNEPAPKVMLMFAWQERLALHDLVKKTAETCKKLKVDKLLIESKAAGISVAQEIRRLYGWEDFGVQLLDPRGGDKLARLYSVQHIFAEGMIFAPDRAWADMVITQVEQFPKGRHDDLVDTCSMGLRHLRDLGMLTRAPERLEEIEQAKLFVSGSAVGPLYPS